MWDVSEDGQLNGTADQETVRRLKIERENWELPVNHFGSIVRNYNTAWQHWKMLTSPESE